MKKYRNPKTKEQLDPKTEALYIGHMRRFVEFVGCHPEAVGVKEINNFLCAQQEKNNYSAITQNQIRQAIVWMYQYVVRRDIEAEGKIIRAKRPQRMPTVCRHKDVMQVLGCVSGKYRLILWLMYGAGLSPAECLRLRIEDINFAQHIISVRTKKGMVGRCTVLPTSLAEQLQRHVDDLHLIWQQEICAGFGSVRTPNEKKISTAWALQWVFPATRRYRDPATGTMLRHHLDATAVQKALRNASNLADLPQRITPRNLRLAFAGKLLEDGANVRTVQEVVGHKNVKNTLEITRALGLQIKGVISPADMVV